MDTSEAAIAFEPEDIVAAARRYLGTPWHHAARLKGIAIDCAGLLICVSRDLGIQIEDTTAYSGYDELGTLRDHIQKYCCVVDPGDNHSAVMAGDILVFRGFQMLNHCGYYTGDNYLVHAWNATGVGCVVEMPMNDKWWSWVVAVYRYKQLCQQPS